MIRKILGAQFHVAAFHELSTMQSTGAKFDCSYNVAAYIAHIPVVPTLCSRTQIMYVGDHELIQKHIKLFNNAAADYFYQNARDSKCRKL